MNEKKLESQRWLIAGAAVVMQLLLGTVYSWSVFKKPLMATHGWAEFDTQLTFMILMGIIGLAAAFGGTLVDKKGPRFVATIGGILFGIGTFVAAYGDQVGSLSLIYLGYGVIGALGIGFGYITPIATLVRWFPDKRGLVTGLAVMGFGLGAFFMGLIAPMMIASFQVVEKVAGQDGATTIKIISSGVSTTFYIWGVIFLVFVTGAAQFYKNPPQGWLPSGFKPAAGTASAAQSLQFGEAVKKPQWWMLWAMLFLNVTAGLGLISQLSPIAQDLYKQIDTIKNLTGAEQIKALAYGGGLVVAVSAVFNGLGRLFWAKLSDNIGRKAVFATMFSTQAVLYILVYMNVLGSYWVFLIVACYLLACFGGGFATMPAFAADSFGPSYIGKVYGFMLTAWACAGLVGPFVFAKFKPQALLIAAILLIIGLLLALVYKKPEQKKA
jgi:OFA family oxalate/formate antiporter-like MFS transporter